MLAGFMNIIFLEQESSALKSEWALDALESDDTNNLIRAIEEAALAQHIT